MNIVKVVKTVVTRPGAVINVGLAHGRGLFYKCWYGITTGGRVKIGKGFKTYGPLRIQGPGRIVIGDNVAVGMYCDIHTHSKDALVDIHDSVYLNGPRFGCAEKITVGHDTLLAECRILDSDFHGLDPENRGDAKKSPIFIGPKCWLTIGVAVLKGSHIPYGCTVTPNSVVNRPFEAANSLYGGNFAGLIKQLKKD